MQIGTESPQAAANDEFQKIVAELQEKLKEKEPFGANEGYF